MKDINGIKVNIGDIVRVLKLPNINFSSSDKKEVSAMIGCNFEIESIENNCVEVSKWLGTNRCHSLYLLPNEFGIVKTVQH